MSAIELRAVSKRFGVVPVLDEVDLSIPAGSITAVLGRSGSGKTTLLRVIAGFEQIDAGSVELDGLVLDDGRRSVVPQRRGVGFVPQDGALFPHLTVAANIAFGLARAERSRVAELCELTGLAGLERRYPHQLSGGQQQRVALARALAIRPRVVLLDEPFSSLDAGLRGELGREVAAILARASTTAVLVTHDQQEALALAETIALLDGGRVLAHGTPRELYHRPPSEAVARSIGEANLLCAEPHGERVLCALGSIPVEPALASQRRQCTLLLRPEQIEVRTQPSAEAALAGVVALRYHGGDALVSLELDAPGHEQLLARVAGERQLERGQRVWLCVNGHGFVLPGTASEAGGERGSGQTQVGGARAVSAAASH